jgi:hypothetical protein
MLITNNAYGILYSGKCFRIYDISEISELAENKESIDVSGENIISGWWCISVDSTFLACMRTGMQSTTPQEKKKEKPLAIL